MRKSFSAYFFSLSVIYLLLGLAMVIWPNSAQKVICFGAGGLLTLYGLARMLISWSDEGFGSLGGRYFSGLLCLLLGLLLLLRADVLHALLSTLLGLAIIADSIIKLQASAALRKNGRRGAARNSICALVTLALGISLLFVPLAAVVYAGICLLIDGLLNLMAAIDVRRNMDSLHFGG
ncbi:MAG: DUF308 domain-containing protein [Christensenellaceae bacterium]|jgi:uncharacterized membrane protein HdeD (DUF308 family)|nr:DUF308 domain-containing protein [Christensenellaceae bacterium]